ncbi:helix-turn-helix domain-containing protein [Mycobacterium sp. DSM 3803]|nr:helix-turn-helix domain-containing protein [Mycobacterium sp. DSM 3803]
MEQGRSEAAVDSMKAFGIKDSPAEPDPLGADGPHRGVISSIGCQPPSAGGQIPLAAIPDPDVRYEWEHFREFGWPDRRIADRLGVQIETVQQWSLRFRATGKPSNTRSLTAKRRARVAELRAAGMAPGDIAAELGVSRHTVHDDCCRLGITAPKQTQRSA